jgi:hypothetical protein
MTELLATAGSSQPDHLPDVSVRPSELDLAAVIPASIYGYKVHVEQMPRYSKISIWQKVNGGMRSVILNRKISKILFWSGILLYAAEGTMHTPSSSQVQFANTRPPINRLFLAFLEGMGIEKTQIKARIQLHNLRDRRMAERFWNKELGLSSKQYTKHMLSKSSKRPRKISFTLHLRYPNSMLCVLLRNWAERLDCLVNNIGPP